MWTSDVQHLAGHLNAVADILSRPSPDLTGSAYKLESMNELVPVQAPATERQVHLPADELSAVTTVALQIVDHAKIAADQQNCEEVKSHRQGQHANGLNMTDVEFSPGIVLYCDVSNGKKARPLVPKQYRDLITRMMHVLNHPGIAETQRKVAERYYWPHMKKDIANFVAACQECQQVKIHKNLVPSIDRIPVNARRFGDLMLDVVGPLPTSTDGMRYLLTIICRTSRFIDAIPMADATSENCTNTLVSAWISWFGLPDTVTSDNGTTFTAKLWKHLHEQLGTLLTYARVYSPSSVGHIERVHRDIKVGLKAALLHLGDTEGKFWTHALPWVLLGKRTAYQPDLGASAADLVFGQALKVPGDLAGAESRKHFRPAKQITT